MWISWLGTLSIGFFLFKKLSFFLKGIFCWAQNCKLTSVFLSALEGCPCIVFWRDEGFWWRVCCISYIGSSVFSVVFFPVAASKIFSFSLVFRSLNRKHVCVSLILDLCFDTICYCWKNPSHYPFRCFTSLFSVFSWDSNDVQVGLFGIDPQLCSVLFLLFTVHFPLCGSVWIISVDLFASSLVVSSAELSLLTSTSKASFTCRCVLCLMVQVVPTHGSPLSLAYCCLVSW